MNLGLPDKAEPDQKEQDIKVDENRTMTILLGENGKLVSYMGMISAPLVAPKDFAYGKDGIRKELLSRRQSVLEYSASKGKPKNGIIVIIKPSKKATYRNLVDILDEMAIVDVPTYAIVNEFSQEKQKLLAAK